jgi:uncharacterized protein (DUF433 family)
VLVPSVSAERVKLWSFPDLMGLRTIYWLRQTKEAPDGYDVPRSTMPAVRKALRALRELDVELWTEETGPVVSVDRNGRIFLRDASDVHTSEGERPLDASWLDLIEPFTTRQGIEGPNLQAPRPNLRILPGKLSGSPHIVRTRIETVAVAALSDRGFDNEKIHYLYPAAQPMALLEAVDLERQLRRNLSIAA